MSIYERTRTLWGSLVSCGGLAIRPARREAGAGRRLTTAAQDTILPHCLLLLLLLACTLSAQELPRFRWENFTTAKACPTTTCTASAWMATASGPAPKTAWRFTRTASGKSYRRRRPGAPRRALAGARQADARSVDRHHGRTEPLLGRPLRHLHATQQRPRQRRGLWRLGAGRLRVGGHRRRRQPPQYAHRRMEPFQRAQHPHVRDLDLWRHRGRQTRSTTPCGAAACWNTT